jgi:hypothetical protein
LVWKIFIKNNQNTREKSIYLKIESFISADAFAKQIGTYDVYATYSDMDRLDWA